MKKNFIPLMLVIASSLTFASCSSEDKSADLVIYNNIFTAEKENNGLAEAIAVKDGKYVYVGNKEGAKSYIKEGKTEVIEDNGLLIPGCTEGHAHYIDGVGLNSQLPANDKSYKDTLLVLKDKYNNEHIKQFVSFGWKTPDLVELRSKSHNFADEIESNAPGIPSILIDNAGHAAVVSRTALIRAGITKDNPLVRGGAIDLDKDGNPTGYIGDQAVFYVVDKVISNLLTDEQYVTACTYGMNELLKYGYTNTVDAFTNMYDPLGIYRTLKQMDENHQLKINVAECFNIKSYDSSVYKERINEVADIAKTYSSTHCDASYIKLFVDGVVESGTGWIFDTYKFPKEGKEHGNIIWERPELDALVSYANYKGLTIHAHTFGDAACCYAIDSFINSNSLNDAKFRNCLAHVRNIRDIDAQRAGENGIPVAANLIWHTDYNQNDPESKKIRDLVRENMGPELYDHGYPMKSLMDKGVVVSSSTDAPAAMDIPGSILNVIEVATTGLAPEDDGIAYCPSELLTIEECLKALTINGAWQIGLENERGSIKVGKYADFVLIDKNILNYKNEELRSIHKAKILGTYFEGEKVFPLNK